MQRVYQAANSIEAHMIVHLLEQAGVHGHVQGEHLQSGAGELPLGNLVAVAVADDDVATAREIIREWEARTTTPAETSSDSSAKSSALGHGIAFLIGALLGGGIVWLMHNGPENVDGLDLNGDGRTDERSFYNGNRIDRVETDRDFDGRADALTEYDASGLPTLYRSDDDFDGVLETTLTYERGQPAQTRVDSDGDGKTDYRVLWKDGVTSSVEYLNPATGRVKKKVIYVDNKQERAYLDLDEDGTWDRSYRFDAIDEPVYEQ